MTRPRLEGDEQDALARQALQLAFVAVADQLGAALAQLADVFLQLAVQLVTVLEVHLADGQLILQLAHRGGHPGLAFGFGLDAQRLDLVNAHFALGRNHGPLHGSFSFC